ncbi:MAG: hypothetical protein ACI90V_007397 [Bacillariaceae sp.]|jgi:hypothetical protein
MTELGQASTTSSFKFPFTDNEESELSLSESFREMQEGKITKNNYYSSLAYSIDDSKIDEEGDGYGDTSTAPPSPSDFGGMGLLSPISKSRDSDVGEIMQLDSVVDPIGTNSSSETNNIIQNDDTTTEQREDNIIIEDSEAAPFSPSSSDNSSSSSSPPTTPPAPTEDDLQSAKKEVGERSSNFIDKIRNAAHKRRVAVTRSRDSLVAKEQEQLRSIAESKTRSAASVMNDLQTVNENMKEAELAKENGIPNRHHSHKHGKSNSIGFGGVGVPKVDKRPTTTPMSPMLGSRRKGESAATFGGTGVPKVEKRPTTTPMSPMLGSRRKGDNAISRKVMDEKSKRPLSGKGSKIIIKGPTAKSSNMKRLSNTVNTNTSNHLDRSKGKEKPSTSSKKETSVGSSDIFKARPVPSSANWKFHAGQNGVPKVSKRAVTVPVSPCLGPRRPSEKKVKRTGKTTDGGKRKSIIQITTSRLSGLSMSTTQNKTSLASPSSVTSSVISADLLGLNLVDSRLTDSTPEDLLLNSITEEESNNNDNSNVTPTNNTASSFKPFEPRSTIRANMRKSYDIRRIENRELKLQEEREQLKLRIKMIHRELIILSKQI